MRTHVIILDQRVSELLPEDAVSTAAAPVDV